MKILSNAPLNEKKKESQDMFLHPTNTMHTILPNLFLFFDLTSNQ